VATCISKAAGTEDASRQLGQSSTQITEDFYIAKPPVAADLSDLLQHLGQDSTGPARGASQTVRP
jgi:hypothetical protein